MSCMPKPYSSLLPAPPIELDVDFGDASNDDDDELALPQPPLGLGLEPVVEPCRELVDAGELTQDFRLVMPGSLLVVSLDPLLRCHGLGGGWS